MRTRPSHPWRSRGFTLIELMVALAAMALLALMSWRGLDAMIRTQQQVAPLSDQVLTLQAGLNQWGADLDALFVGDAVGPMDWDGQVLRLVRRSTGDTGVRVVAWSRRASDSASPHAGQWVRWQSPVTGARGDLLTFWEQAHRWGHAPSDADMAQETALVGLTDWQLYYFRKDTWSNPQSSDGQNATGGAQGMPDGVRVILNLAPGGAFAGRLTRDWVRPTRSGGLT